MIERCALCGERWAVMAKPILIYDGECRFCRRCVAWCKTVTGDRVDYEPSRTAGARFPQIAPEKFDQAVQWVGADGTLCAGAQAVFSTLATSTWTGRTLLTLYRTVPFFAFASEAVYALVARKRAFFSRLTRKFF